MAVKIYRGPAGVAFRAGGIDRWGAGRGVGGSAGSSPVGGCRGGFAPTWLCAADHRGRIMLRRCGGDGVGRGGRVLPEGEQRLLHTIRGVGYALRDG